VYETLFELEFKWVVVEHDPPAELGVVLEVDEEQVKDEIRPHAQHFHLHFHAHVALVQSFGVAGVFESAGQLELHQVQVTHERLLNRVLLVFLSVHHFHKYFGFFGHHQSGVIIQFFLAFFPAAGEDACVHCSLHAGRYQTAVFPPELSQLHAQYLGFHFDGRE